MIEKLINLRNTMDSSMANSTPQNGGGGGGGKSILLSDQFGAFLFEHNLGTAGQPSNTNDGP